MQFSTIAVALGLARLASSVALGLNQPGPDTSDISGLSKLSPGFYLIVKTGNAHGGGEVFTISDESSDNVWSSAPSDFPGLDQCPSPAGCDVTFNTVVSDNGPFKLNIANAMGAYGRAGYDLQFQGQLGLQYDIVCPLSSSPCKLS